MTQVIETSPKKWMDGISTSTNINRDRQIAINAMEEETNSDLKKTNGGMSFPVFPSPFEPLRVFQMYRLSHRFSTDRMIKTKNLANNKKLNHDQPLAQHQLG